MRISSLVCLTALFAGSVSAALAAPADSDLKASFQVSQQTEVPGLVLKPGSYSIRVVDHLSDRFIIRIDDTKNGHHATFIALPNKGIAKSGAGMVTYDSGPDGGAAARGFSFPGGTAVEFVYPKAEAVSLAKLNSTSVTAIDPASEGRTPKDNELSKDDMEVVTLWTLSSTKVGPGEDAPAIKAERYKATDVAKAEPAAPLGKVRRSASTDTATSGQPAAPKPVIAKLPHTASAMPLVYLLGIFSLLGAAVLRFGRFTFLNNN